MYNRKPLLMTAFKNQVMKLAASNPFNHELEIQFYLKNISINREKRGCSGFVLDGNSGSCVYITTEPCFADKRVMYRYALSISDYSSNGITNGNNRWCEESELAENVLQLLRSGCAIPKEKKSC